MATHEKQDKCVVVRVAGIDVEIRDDEQGLFGRSGGFAVETGIFAACVVDHSACGDADKPGARVVRSPLCGPLTGGCDQRFLHSVLGSGEIAKAMEQDAEHLRREVAEKMLGVGVQGMRCHGG